MAYDFKQFKTRVLEVTDWLQKEMMSIRTGRATPTLLDSIQVESYGSRVPLKQVGSINVEDPRTLRVTLWDKEQVRGVESAIAASNLGVSAIADGNSVRVVFPELTTEKRTILLKLAKDKVEEARISLRKERERVWSDIQDQERTGQVSEDEKFRLKDELQKMIDAENKNLEEINKRKEGEISL
ncbi:MAG: ribosome recycling factor [Patescibacteria group bacterium]|nr:ribosome recycling factor [Patescibacteria group bacterium]